MKDFGQLLVIAVLWTGWCAVHSLLISQGMTKWMKAHLKKRFAFFRIGYVLFSTATVIPAAVYTYIAEQKPLFAWTGPWRLLQILLIVYSLVMFYGGMKVYDLKYFVGISQAKDYFAGRRPGNMEFVAKGMMRVVRHPWYSGGIAIVWAFGPVTDVTLVARIILTLYLVIGTVLEERKLVSEIGEPYRRYREQVPMLVPLLWRKRRKLL